MEYRLRTVTRRMHWGDRGAICPPSLLRQIKWTRAIGNQKRQNPTLDCRPAVEYLYRCPYPLPTQAPTTLLSEPLRLWKWQRSLRRSCARKSRYPEDEHQADSAGNGRWPVRLHYALHLPANQATPASRRETVRDCGYPSQELSALPREPPSKSRHYCR